MRTEPFGTSRLFAPFLLTLLSAYVLVPPCPAQFERYEPNPVCPGDTVRIFGEFFGGKRPATPPRVTYGRERRSFGELPVIDWRGGKADVVTVRLPAKLAPATYWTSISWGKRLFQGAASLVVGKCRSAPGKGPAELFIRDIRPAGSLPACIQPFPIDVVIGNRGGAPADVHASYVEGRWVRQGARGDVPAGGTTTIRTFLDIKPELLRGRTFTTTVFVQDHARRGETLSDTTFLDGNLADHQREVSYPIVDLWDVRVRLREIGIVDDCDSVSNGDWIVWMWTDVQTCDGQRRIAAREWRNGDVATGSRHPVGREFTLRDIRGDQDLAIVVAAIDCDDNTWLPPTLDRLGTRCLGEDFPEVSGDHDWAGTVELILTPEQWQSGGEFTHRHGSAGTEFFRFATEARNRVIRRADSGCDSSPAFRVAVDVQPLRPGGSVEVSRDH